LSRHILADADVYVIKGSGQERLNKGTHFVCVYVRVIKCPVKAIATLKFKLSTSGNN